MNHMMALGKAVTLVVALCVVWTTTAASQGRSSGNSRNPDETKRTEPAPASSPSPRRDIGRTRQEEPVPPQQPPTSNGGDRSRRGGSTSGAGNETPPPRVEREPPHQPPRHDVQHLPPPPPACSGGDIEIGVALPPAPRGIWIRDGVNFGRNVTLSDMRTMPDYSGYDFSDLLKRPYDDAFTDMAVESDPWGDLHMLVREDTEIMELGAAEVPADVIYIPPKEWSTDHSVRLRDGYEYVVRTWDGHYAKFVVTSITGDHVTFDWAYQYNEGTTSAYHVAPVREEGFMRFSR